MTKVLRVLLAVARGAHTNGAVAAATGLPAELVGGLLRYALGRGDVTRAGPRGRYSYRHVDPLARLQALANSINPPLTESKDGACILSSTRYVGDIETEATP